MAAAEFLLLLAASALTLTPTSTKKEEGKAKGGRCSLTFHVDADEIQGLCRSPTAAQPAAIQDLQNIKKENAELKAALEEMREEYKSMVDTVKQLKEETATWREIVEWPLMDAVFRPDNESLYINPDGPTYKDCRDAVSRNNKQGIYSIQPADALSPFLAYCDEEGWTVIQRRFDGSEDFYRDWDDYQAGFGRLSGEYWLGLENIHLLTKQDNYDLKVEVLGYNGKLYSSESPGFKLEGEDKEYVLHIGNMTSGNYKDLMIELDGLAFTTKDNDNDEWWENNCAYYYRGAFWLKNCGFDLNREYCDGRGCMTWGERVAKKSLMKIRPSSGTHPVASKPAKKFKKAKKPKSRG